MQPWTRCLLTSVRVGVEGETALGAPGSRSPDCCHRSVCPCSSFRLPSLAQLPVGHRKLRVRRHRALFRLSRQSILSSGYATTDAGATSGDKETLGAGSLRCAARGCVDVLYDPSNQGQLHDVLGRAVHLPYARWAVLWQDEARAVLRNRGGSETGRVSKVEAMRRL